MNDETALQTIEDYFACKATQVQYEAALNYFATAPESRSRLAKLYRALVEPGGIGCETCQEEMLRYLDLVTRREMTTQEREQFLLHVSQCVNCAEEYLELASFEQGLELAPSDLKIPRFKMPQPAPKTGNWPPLLKARIDRIVESARKLKLSMKFEPAPLQGAGSLVRETSAPYSAAASELTLFTQPKSENLPADIKVTARRASDQAEECEVRITLESQPPNNYSVMLSYGEQREEKATDGKGRVTFEAIPLAALPDLQIEITLNR